MPFNISQVQSSVLPTGAATETTLGTASTTLTTINTKLATAKTFDLDTGVGVDTVQAVGIALPASGGSVVGGTATNPIRTDPTGTTTQPVSISTSVPITAAALPLPAGASTAAKQPALGTAGTASTDVITIQGIAGATAVKVDGSAVTQPVSGTITANIGTSGSLALDATLTGGTAKSINRGGAKGTTTAADVTSTASGANHQPIDVAIYDASGNQLGLAGTPIRTDPTGTTTQPVSGTVAVSGTVPVSIAASVAITAAALPLPTGAATETTLGTRLADATFTGRINTLGAKTSANSTPVVIASDQSILPIGPVNDVVGGTVALNALNAAAVINAAGMVSVGMNLQAGTLIGTLVAEASFDGGSTFPTLVSFDDPATSNKVNSLVFASSNPATVRTIIGAGGASNYRVRVSAFTSGTANCNLRACFIEDPSVLYSGPSAGAPPLTVAQMGGIVSATAPAPTAGTLTALSINPSGGVRVEATDVKSNTASTPAQSTATTTASTGLAANAARKMWACTNTGAQPLIVAFGTNPTATAFHEVVAPAATYTNDGLGGRISNTYWTGSINVIVATGSTTYNIYEIT